MAKIYSSKAFLKMADEEMHPLHPPWIRPCSSLQLANSTLRNQAVCFENHAVVVSLKSKTMYDTIEGIDCITPPTQPEINPITIVFPRNYTILIE